MTASGVTDNDEYGSPVDDRYKRLGAGADREDEAGLYVRFEPGFGLNVHIGYRQQRWLNQFKKPICDDPNEFAMSIGGWEKLCSFVDEWRARVA